MTAPLIAELTPEQIRTAVVDRYGHVATDPTGSFNFPVGRTFAEAVGYPAATLDSLPDEASRSFAGVTYYHGRTNLQPGETVLDLGCGAGMDMLIAARAVGTTGKVIAVDYSEEMATLARANAKRAGVANVAVHHAPIERLPVADATIDVAQANGVFNLSAAKEQAVSEVYRALKPGGRLIAAEIALTRDVPAAERATLQDWFR
jgi:arsenite methyltransferase